MVLQEPSPFPSSVDSSTRQLQELVLQALIYTESANMRHIPQLLCLIYYMARDSREFMRVRGGEGGKGIGEMCVFGRGGCRLGVGGWVGGRAVWKPGGGAGG